MLSSTLTRYFWPENFCNERRALSVDLPRSLRLRTLLFDLPERPDRIESASLSFCFVKKFLIRVREPSRKDERDFAERSKPIELMVEKELERDRRPPPI